MKKLFFILMGLALLVQTSRAAVGTGPSSGGPTNGITAATATNTIKGIKVGTTLFVAPNGNDSVGARGTLYPFLTMRAAQNAAISGDTIIVYPGAYNETGLGTNGVNWHFMTGASNYWMSASTNEAQGFGMFDDRYAGAAGMSFRITGNLDIFESSGTNVTYITTNNVYIGNRFNFGPLFFTNVNSSFDISIHNGYMQYMTTPLQPAFLTAQGCTNSFFRFNELVDAQGTNIFDTGRFRSNGTNHVTGISQSSGIIWGAGDLYSEGNVIDYFPVYGVWGNMPTPAIDANLWCKVHKIGGKVYMSQQNQADSGLNYRAWFVCEEITGKNSIAGSLITLFGCNSYFTLQKAVDEGISGILDYSLGAQVHFNCQKVTANSGFWVKSRPVGIGTVPQLAVINVEQFQDAGGGTMTQGIQIADGTNTITGQFATISNGNVLALTGGQVDVNNLRMDSSTTVNATNYPVSVDGGRLNLQSTRLIGPAGSQSIGASAPVTVQSFGVHGNLTNSGNVTILGEFTNNASFR